MENTQSVINNIKKYIDRIETAKTNIKSSLETINFSIGEINVLLKQLPGNENFKGYDTKENDEYFEFINKGRSGLS